MKAEELFTGDSSKIKVGDTIEFGSYPQENDTPSPIDWYVLKAKDNRVFVLCKDIIKCKSYHEESADITWEDCT